MSAPRGRGAETAGAGERPLDSTRVAILGCGAVGGALALGLAQAGADLALWSRTSGRAAELARRLAQRVPGARASAVDELAAALAGADVALLCVTDEALAAFAHRCAATAARPGAGAVAVHTNGSHGLAVLDPLREAGWEVARLAPLAALPPGGEPGRLLGAWFAAGASPGAGAVLERLVAALEGHVLEAPAEDREDGASARTVHAGAALLSGGLVALLDTAAGVARAAGADPAAAEAALTSLAESTIRNVRERGARGALTGPVARGAVGVVAGHLAALDATDPDAGRLYRLLAGRMLSLAHERGSIDDGQRAQLEDLLRS